jgi:toxin ParE1/3/4
MRRRPAGVADRFAAAVERALDHVALHPATGSLRYSQMADAPGLRSWPLRRFPYLVFHVEEADHRNAARRE